MSKTVEEQIGEVTTLVQSIQTEHTAKSKSYGEEGAKRDATIANMEKKVGEVTESIQKEVAANKAAADASKKQIEELTLAIARGGNNDSKTIKPEDVEMTDDVKSMFSTALRKHNGTYQIDSVVANEIVTDQVKRSFPHITNDLQDVVIKSILAQGSSPAGGMWCPVPIDARIRNRVFETSPLRQLAEVINVASQGMTFALDDEELIAESAGEVDTRNETETPEFGEVRININEIFARPKATLQVLEDSTLNLESWVSGKASNKFARKQNAAFINGDGIKEATGILTYADTPFETYARNKIGTGDTAAAITLAGDDLIDLQSHLIEDYQSNANWVMHRLIWAKTIKLKDDEGQYLLNPAIMFQGVAPQLLGAPVRMAGDMPKPTAAGLLVAGTTYVAYGDFREGYTILDRLGINVIMDNITQPGFVSWYFRTRYGGGVTNFQAFKRLKASS